MKRTRAGIHGKRAFLFCHNVWPSCCFTIPHSICLVVLAQHAQLNALGKGAVLMQRCSKSLCGTQIIDSRNCKSPISILPSKFCAYSLRHCMHWYQYVKENKFRHLQSWLLNKQDFLWKQNNRYHKRKRWNLSAQNEIKFCFFLNCNNTHNLKWCFASNNIAASETVVDQNMWHKHTSGNDQKWHVCVSHKKSFIALITTNNAPQLIVQHSKLVLPGFALHYIQCLRVGLLFFSWQDPGIISLLQISKQTWCDLLS